MSKKQSTKQSTKTMLPLAKPMPMTRPDGMPGKGSMPSNLQRMPMTIPKARKPK